MTRSLFKGPYIHTSLWTSFLKNSNLENGKKIWNRSSTILPQYVGKEVQVYTGIRFLRIKILEDMIGHKFGEFASTRKKPIHKNKKINK
jgi:small subunit ribosomal protein S19